MFGGEDFKALPESVTGRQLTYASSETYLFQASLRDNLLYGLKHAPVAAATYDDRGLKYRNWMVAEAKLAGNPDCDINSDWIDPIATDLDQLPTTITNALDAVLLSKDILDFGLRSIVNPADHADLAVRIVEMRHALREELEQADLSSLVVYFEPGVYNTEATVGENMLFGMATGPELMGRAIASNAYFISLLSRLGLDRILYAMGLEIAENAVNLFGDLPPDHPFFQQLTFMTADDLPQYQLLLQRLKGKRFEDVSREDRVNITRLSFLYIEPRHRFGLLTAELMDKIIEARREFHTGLPKELSDAIERYDPERYLSSASLLDNVLMGKISHKHSDGSERIRAIVRKLLDRLGLYESALSIGMEYNVGAGGRRLTQVQRQKLNLARAIVRRSQYYVFNRPLPSLDQRVQDQIMSNIIALLKKDGRTPTILWVLTNANRAEMFDRVLVFNKGSLVGDGAPKELLDENDIFKELVS